VEQRASVDLPIIGFNYGTEIDRDANVLDDAPEGDGYSW